MVKTVGVCIACDDDLCSTNCPYFKLEVGASFEKPYVEYCRLFRQTLRLTPKNTPIRCLECQKQEELYQAEAMKFVLQKRCQQRPAALRLLQATNYTVDIYEYQHPATLLQQLLTIPGITRAYLCKLISITESHLDELLAGYEYPYLLRPLKQTLGFPREEPLSPIEMTFQKAVNIRRSDRE